MTPAPDHAEQRSATDILLADPILGQCSRASLARALAHASPREVSANTVLYSAGEAASHFYLLVDGAITLVSPGGRRCALVGPRFGEEAASDANDYLTDALALEQSTLLCLPRSSMQALAAANPGLRTDLLLSLTSHLAGEHLMPAEKAPDRPASGYRRHAALGWLLVIVLPVLTMAGGEHLGLARHISMFLAIFGATMTMWVCNLADDYVPALFALLAILLTGLVPTPVILSGFASEGFLMALSTLALGAVVLSSGLGYRFMLWMLDRLPNTQFWHNVGMFITGLVLTPLIPTANGRVALLVPLYADMAENLRLQRGERASTRLALTCFSGASLLSATFITAKSVNFAVFNLLSQDGQGRFQWLTWAMAASVSALVLLVINGLAAAIWFRNRERRHLSKAGLLAQRKLLGRINTREWAAILGIAFMGVGILTSSVHKVEPSWLGFAMLYALLLCGMLNRKEFKEKVDWTSLLYLAGITGMVAAFRHLGLDQSMSVLVPVLGDNMRQHFALFVLLLFVLINLLRLAVPSNAVTVILASLLMPLARASGVNDWLVGFIILVFSDAWFFPYQCSYYMPFHELNTQSLVFDARRFLRFNAVLNVSRLLAVYAAFPYWRLLGIL
ncbi:SLC13 family permease [Massilia sp. CF038]|uniref:SLC13 family permease n=1 Tax=Massilia sp. CF038 TaxID=1881045 RepID=UPI00091E83A2|nr:SLC13 family permease [Massilia sp. CF038]SHG48708.1 Di-and tricarboxylate transporter [Massilia sp. CF038]